MPIDTRDWYRDEHPPTCSCAECTRKRLQDEIPFDLHTKPHKQVNQTKVSQPQGNSNTATTDITQREEQPKPKRWKVIAGWILLVWGFIGLASNLFMWLPSGVNLGGLIINSGVCILFIYGGWKLQHSNHE